jgi:hypothetical protein
MKQAPLGFAIAYAVLGAVALASLVATVVLFFVIAPANTVAHKSDIQDALGATSVKALVKQAEKAVGQSAASSGVTLTSQKVVSVKHPDASTVVIVIKATTAEYGPVNLKLTFRKGIYSLGPIEQA